MKRKGLVLIFCIALLSICICAVASAGTAVSGDFTFSTNDNNGTATVTAWKGTAGTEVITIPTVAAGVYRVVGVSGSTSFKGAGLKKIILPDSLSGFSGQIDSTTTLQCDADSAVASTISRFVSTAQPEYALYVRNKEITILEYTGSSTNVTIPSSVNGVKVTKIGSNAFKSNGTLASVTIPTGVTSIGSSAFASCGNLESVILHESLTTLGESCFEGCGNLLTLELPSTVTSIGYHTLNKTGITELDLPEGLSTVQAASFDSKTVLYCYANSKAASKVNNFRSRTQPNYVLYERNNAITIKQYIGSAAEVTIPTPIDGVPVTVIDSSAFKSNGALTSVDIPVGVTKINNSAFASCGNLSSVTLHESLTTLGESCFEGCGNLLTLELPSTVTSIGYHALNKTGITELDLPAGLSTVQAASFDSKTVLYCFANSKAASSINNFRSKTEPDYVLYTRNNAITIKKYNGSDAEVNIPSTIDDVPVTIIDASAFKSNGTLTKLTVPAGVTKINSSAFASCGNLSSVTLHESLTTLGESCFEECGNLLTLELPSTVISIGYHALNKTGITELELPAGLSTVQAASFDSKTELYCFANSKAASSINNFRSKTEPDYVLYTRNNAITIKKYNGSDAEVNIPSTIDDVPVTIIDASAFKSNGTLTKLTIPAGVTKINSSAFASCGSLASVTLHESLITLGDSCFEGCGNLLTFELPSTVTSIGYHALYKTGIVELDLPEGLSSVQAASFDGNTVLYCYANSKAAGLINNFRSRTEPNYDLYTRKDVITLKKYNGSDAEVTIPSSIDDIPVKTVESNAFSSNGTLTSVTIPAGVTSIGTYAFSSCGNLISVSIPNGVSSIGEGAFRNCSSLGTVEIPKSVSTIGSNAFPKKQETLVFDCDTTAYTWAKKNQYPNAEINPQAAYKYQVNHLDMKIDEAKDPTPDSTGLTEGKHCDACNDVIIAQQVLPAVTLNSVKLSEESITAGETLNITATTSTSVTRVRMYEGGTAIESWTEGYTDNKDVRTWSLTYVFEEDGEKELTFKASGVTGEETEGEDAELTVTARPTLTSVKFSKTKATVKQNVTITAVTSTTASKLEMYAGKTLTKSWTDGYTDDGTTRTWKVTFAFAGTGSKTMTFKAQDDHGIITAAKKATIKITAAPTLTSVKFSKTKATVKQTVTITAVTSTNTTKLNMYNGSKLIKSWTEGFTDDEGVRTWKVKYAFSGTGSKKMSFKAVDANGYATSAKTITITITAAPTLTSVKFNSTTGRVKQNVTIIAETSTNATKLNMYNGTKLIKSWTSGYTSNGTIKTWKVTFAFTGAGTKTMTFKAVDANGYATAAKTAKITIKAGPTLTSVKFNSTTATVKKKVTITAVTTTDATKLTMYSGSKAIKSWTTGYTDSGTKRTWKVTYAFTGTGKKTMTFKAFDANGKVSDAKKATIEIKP